jgi:serine/threonine protein kinase
MSPERIRNRPYSYMSDIWSLGLVLMECATGKYPFHEHANCIEVAQTILDADIPALPRGFSTEFTDFLQQCLHKDPEKRLPAEVLLGSPWLLNYRITSPEIATENVFNWISMVTGGR